MLAGFIVDNRLSTTSSTVLFRRRPRYTHQIQKILRRRLLDSHSLNIQLRRSTLRHPHNMGLPPSLGKTKRIILPRPHHKYLYFPTYSFRYLSFCFHHAPSSVIMLFSPHFPAPSRL